MVNFRLVATVAVTGLIFLSGIFFGQYISYYYLSELKQTQEKMIYEMTGYELAYSLLSGKEMCNISFRNFIKERAELGQQLASLEERFGSKNEEIKSMQERYHLYQIREYLFFKKLNEECDFKIPSVLYFYSDDCDLCIAQGKILDALYAKYCNNDQYLNIYAIDYKVDNIALNSVKNLYGINTTPSIVVNGETYNRFLGFEELEKILWGE